MPDDTIDARTPKAIPLDSGDESAGGDSKPGTKRKADGGEFTGSGTAFTTAPGEHPPAPDTRKQPKANAALAHSADAKLPAWPNGIAELTMPDSASPQLSTQRYLCLLQCL